jgi:hypothetical protein
VVFNFNYIILSASALFKKCTFMILSTKSTLSIQLSTLLFHKGSVQAVTTETREEKEKWSELLKIRDKKVKFKLDTGAECNVLSLKTYNSLGITEKLSKSTCKLLAYSGHQMSPLGQNQLTCEYKGQKHIIQFQIVERDPPAILGRSTCQSLGLIKRIHEVSVENDDIMKNYEDLFSGL